MASILAFFRRLLRFFGIGGPESVSHAAPASPPPAPAAPAPATPAPPLHEMEEPMGDGFRPAPGPTTLAMPQLMALSGQFPTRGDGGTNAYFTLGMVQTFAGSSAAYGAPRAEGQTLQISNPPTNQALFSVLGTTFGGNGMTTFGIPNLVNRAAIGGQQAGMFGQGTLTMNWLISTGPSSLAPVPGTLAMFGANYAPDGWAICDGSTLPISQYVPLFQAIGTAFGGNGESVFLLPKLNDGAAPVGAGQGPGRAPVTVGQQIAGTPPGLGINYLISVEGPYPPSSGPGAFPDTGQFLGQVIAYAGGGAPSGWALCDGSLQPISGNSQLFELIGTSYGGDGQTTFALPDLRGLMVTGLGG
jgi:microcystin-dependent protein